MNTKGFTLVEVLIGLFIAILASTYAAKTIVNTNKVIDAGRDTFVATNLAHEGIDLTRAMRDNTWLMDMNATPPIDRSNWMSQSGICADEPDPANHSYTLDPEMVREFVETEGDSKVGDSNLQLLFIRGTSKQWLHDNSPGHTVTPYGRLLEADCSEADEFVTITSTVTWFVNGQAKSVLIKERLYNWL